MNPACSSVNHAPNDNGLWDCTRHLVERYGARFGGENPMGVATQTTVVSLRRAALRVHAINTQRSANVGIEHLDVREGYAVSSTSADLADR